MRSPRSAPRTSRTGKFFSVTDTAETTEETPPQPKPDQPPWWERPHTITGTAVGLVFLWLSMTPSLLPRGPLFQAIVSGAAGAIGYGLGVFAGWLGGGTAAEGTHHPAPRAAGSE